MYTKRNYGFWMTLNWSKWPLILGTIYSAILFLISDYLKIELAMPWQPISIVGIAVAFYLGFKNNSSYDRTWEARKIWGSIVNDSRSFGAAVVSFVKGDNERGVRKELIYRHIAWLTALRYQLRLSRDWEHTDERLKGKFVATICEQYIEKLDGELEEYIETEEINDLKLKSNVVAQILKTQSERLQDLKEKGYFEDFRHMEFFHIIANLYADQGKSERIKNFPFPRQYASTALWLTLVFCALMPFGILDIFHGMESPFLYWAAPLVCGLLIWIFFLMEKIGDYSENPFEGTYNDVPITSISKGIEIDLKEMIDDSNIPKPIEAENGFLL